MWLAKFPFINQLDSSDCGLACIRIITKYYGIKLASTHSSLIDSNLTKQGLTFSGLKSVSENIGYKSLIVKLTFQEMKDNVKLPAIFFWQQNHFIVVYKIHKGMVYVSDPAIGKTKYRIEGFITQWIGKENIKGTILLLQPTSKIAELGGIEDTKDFEEKKVTLRYILRYLFYYKTQLYFICVTLITTSFIDLLLPFFTQKIIDKGVRFENISLMYALLSGQIVLFIGKTANEYYRSWLFTHISTRINVNLILNFLGKLMTLPIKFFDSKNTGDIIQRIGDHKRVETFLSKDIIQFIFSIFTAIIYVVVLFVFSTQIAFIFLFGTIVKLLWIFRFLNRIGILDRKQFYLLSSDQNKILEFIKGMQEIKLNNLESQKKLQWEKIQGKLFKHDIEKLQVEQKYEGYRFINFIINILVTFFAALAVIKGEMTYGTLLSIVFVIGGMNVPMTYIINFFLQLERVKVSFERMNQIYNMKDETQENSKSQVSTEEPVFNPNKTISFTNLYFGYNSSFGLENINLTIPIGGTTAIVGVSGSGKTTLLKLMLKFYRPQKGTIKIGEQHLNSINERSLRNKCGAIMQDSFIFSESIAFNIALDFEYDKLRLENAIQLSNIETFIESLPLKASTIIGEEGVQISHGQRQRILIARIIYKNPELILFDEATNSLDAENEKVIVQNISNYFKGKTMLVVAHRLSTVRDADQIVVMDAGRIVENGTHETLILKKGKYYELISNQLELVGTDE